MNSEQFNKIKDVLVQKRSVYLFVCFVLEISSDFSEKFLTKNQIGFLGKVSREI